LWNGLLVPDELQAGVMVDAYRRATSGNRRSKDIPRDVRRAVVRALVNARGEVPVSNFLTQRQHACARDSVLSEGQGDATWRSIATGAVGAIGQINRACLAEGGCRIQVAGAEVQSEVLHILPGEVAGGNVAHDLRDGEKVVRR